MTEIDRLKTKREQIKNSLSHYEQQVSGCLGALKVLDDLISELNASSKPPRKRVKPKTPKEN